MCIILLQTRVSAVQGGVGEKKIQFIANHVNPVFIFSESLS